ncbi:radical SAM protein [Streptomyces sp. DSM 41524]|uniref:Radical SAM protein n=1 Tax=Streptomyces asiaticus subsp. ignotus TaxID=3098222 RepID=A0ABU7Q431_9ACTN|nr:radical SAM protein [Streptomyces sp. DSM 41524]
MRVLMVEPTVYQEGALDKRPTRPTQLVSLTLPYLAALASDDVEIQIAYEMNEDLDDAYDLASYDVIALTVQTIHLKRGLELLRAWRGLGPTLVVGGPATVEDDERLVPVLGRFADAVAVGDGEETWPRILDDVRSGSLKSVYRPERPTPMANAPLPRFELVNFDHIDAPHVLPSITARGCPRRCTFCSEFLYSKWLLRPVDDVIDELLQYRDRFGIPRVCFRDDDFLVHPKRSRELLSRLAGEGIEWACQTDFNLARHPDLLEVALESGMRVASFGMESVREDNRKWTEKTFFTIPEAEDLLVRLHEAGVETQVNVIFGFDYDDPDVFEETFALLERTHVSRFFPSILYPIPGTPLYEQLRAEDRLLNDHAPGIDDPLLVWFKPKHLTPDQLVEGYLDLEQQFAQLPTDDKNYWLGRDIVVI